MASGRARPSMSCHSTGFYKGREILHPRIGRKENRVANAVCISYTTVTFHRFYSVSQFASCTNTELFCFCKPILSRSVNKYCWFLLMLPLLYIVTGHIMCPVKLCYIIQHLRHVDNEKVG